MVAVGRLFIAFVAMWLALAPATYAVDPRSADWLRTVHDSALWSGAADPAVQFTTLPVGSFLQPRGGSDTGRLLVDLGEARALPEFFALALWIVLFGLLSTTLLLAIQKRLTPWAIQVTNLRGQDE